MVLGCNSEVRLMLEAQPHVPLSLFPVFSQEFGDRVPL